MTFKQAKRVMDKMNLATALWWFIENIESESPIRSEAFFYLRERVRTED